ncbi:hypothetical protein [Bradyrhizobium sp. SBR1B]|nr:hypothetical protein [Bradyrhizobium sp. SBR1B]MBB4383353.1 hypothetical protein [Bradyrhizobium sp. SBR1B]
MDQQVTNGTLVSSTLVLRECNKQGSEELHGCFKPGEAIFIAREKAVRQ